MVKTMKSKFKRLAFLSIALSAVLPVSAMAEYATSYKQTTEQEYRAVAKKNSGGIVSELSTQSQAALASQLDHMNQYEKEKYAKKMNMYYGTKRTVDSFESAGNDYANKIRLNVENTSRATVVEHEVDIEKMKNSAQTAYGVGNAAPAGMDEKTYERMQKTQEAARSSGAVGMDFAKEMLGNPAAMKGSLQGIQGK